jgi:carotenoid cleavage dioxygenase-like enzyme
MTMETGFELGFRSLDQEVTDREIPVEGDLPPWLDGVLVRNGPAKFEVGADRVGHWFDGLGMLHRFEFGAGAVRYTNRFLRSETYRRATEAGILRGQFATGGGYLRRLWDMVVGEPTDNCNVHVSRVADRLVARTEVPRYMAVDPATLETHGDVDFADELGGHLDCAHVLPDPHEGETVGLLTRFGRSSEYTVYRRSEGSQTREPVGRIQTDEPAYLHSFALTESYVVITEHPFLTDPISFFLPGNEGFVDFFDWRPDRPTTVHVIERATGERVAAAETDPWFVFHHVNAYERRVDDATDVVVDLVSYPDASVVTGLSLGNASDWLANGTDGRLRRVRVPLGGGEVSTDILYEGCELPRVVPEDRTRPYRYVYAQGAAASDGNHVAKVAVETGESNRYAESGLFFEEPVPVRAPGGDPQSDDGVVLVTALNTAERRTDLLVLDGKTLTERARVRLPHAVPFGFHGRYFAEW